MNITQEGVQQTALLRYTRALRGIRLCRWRHTLSWSFPEPQFNGNGSHLACFAGNTIRIRNAYTGQQEVALNLVGHHDGWMRFRWARDGTHAGIIMRSAAGVPAAGKADMLDPAVAEHGWAAMEQRSLSALAIR
ncbi:hypothetical protein WJX73_002162 [Symbiochloris irregularis]|uniref:Uncharacterized protein n=1 Tax=Symbiochloris irregularis TaxID=706552 RepID=A0AAW1NZN3_9CHLO